MDFLSNLFGRVFGRKREEEERALRAAPSPAPSRPPVAVPAVPVSAPERQPVIAPAQLSKAPQYVQAADRQQSPLNPGADNAFWRGIDKIAGGGKAELPVWDVGKDASFAKKAVPGIYNTVVKDYVLSPSMTAFNTGLDVGDALSGTVRDPGESRSPVTELIGRSANLAVGNEERPQDVIGAAGAVASEALKAFGLTGAGNYLASPGLSMAARSGGPAGRQAIRKIAGESARFTRNVGAAEGFASGLRDSSDRTILGQLASGVGQAVVGGAAGYGLGFGLPYASYGAQGAFRRAGLGGSGNQPLHQTVIEQFLREGRRGEAKGYISMLPDDDYKVSMASMMEDFYPEVAPVIPRPAVLDSVISSASGTGRRVSRAAAEAEIQGARQEARAIREVAPGITSVNPERTALADAIEQAPLTRTRFDIPEVPMEPGPITRTRFDAPDPAAVQAMRDAAATGARTMNDIDPVIRTPEEIQAFDPNPAPIQPQVAPRPIAQDIMPPQALETVPPLPRAAQAPAQSPLAPEAQAFMPAAQAEGGVAVSAAPARPPLPPQEPQVPLTAPPAADGPVPAAFEAPQTVQAQPAPEYVARPELPQPTPGNVVEAAPRLRQALMRFMGDIEGVPTQGPVREQVNLAEARKRAAGAVERLSDQEVLAAYSDDSLSLASAEEYSLARAALGRLGRMAKAAKDVSQESLISASTAASNVLRAMGEGAADRGLYLRMTQEAFDDLPTILKISRAIKAMRDGLSPDDPNFMKFDDPKYRARIEEDLDSFFDSDLTARNKLAAVSVELQEALARVEELGNSRTKEQRELAKGLPGLKERFKEAFDEVNGIGSRFAEYWEKEAPAGKSFGDAVGDYQRAAMLSSVLGRFNDVFNTNVMATGRETLISAVEGAVGRALNMATRSPGRYLDSAISPSDLVRAVPEGIAKTVAQAKGRRTVGSVGEVVQRQKLNPNRSDMTDRNRGAFINVVRAGTEAATHLSKGVENAQAKRLLRQEGQRKGLKGIALKNYVDFGSIDPNPDVAHNARRLMEEVNNINKNAFTSFAIEQGQNIERLVNSVTGQSQLGRIAKNAFVLFPTWTGGNIRNMAMDRNVVTNAAKFAKALAGGRDPQKALNQFSKALVGAGEAYAAGYLLSQQGILSETDANGNDYDGLYFKAGNYSIPVMFAGPMAANVILGNAYHQAVNSEGNAYDKLKEGMSSAVGNIAKAYDPTALFGQDGWLSRTVAQAVDGDVSRAGATALTGLVGQGIPSAFGDLNAFINSSRFNPTGEAAETKVVNEGTGKTDFALSAASQLANRLPIASQLLPRKDGVAAQNPFDRITRGNHELDASKESRIKAEDAVTRRRSRIEEYGAFSDDFRNILDEKDQRIFDKAKDGKKVTQKELDSLVSSMTKGIESDADSRFLEDGNYDANLTALKMKRDKLADDPTTRKAVLESYDDQIKRGEVYKEMSVPYSRIKAYKDVSLTEWRDMGDPRHEDYDPAMYQALWDLDVRLAKEGASRRSGDKTKQKYYAKKGGSGGGGGSASKNTVGSPTNLGTFRVTGLSGRSSAAPSAPRITRIKPSELVKKRKISVTD